MIDLVNDKINEYISDLKEPIVNELFSKISQGKRLRTKLISNIAEQSKDAPTLGAIIEFIHLASLLHDDVIDEALTRRGKASINALFGDKTAIMLGDILYSKAFFELTTLPKTVAKIVSSAVTKLSIGELQDVSMGESFNENETLYFEMIYNKTASLIEASAKSAAILSQKDANKFALYGKNLGLAFQVVDDILDITSESQTLGKPSFNDFKEGKTTLPYIYMYKQLDTKEQQRLKNMFKKTLQKDEIDWIKKKMMQTGALEQSISKAKEFGALAKKSLEGENITKLDAIIDAMIERDF